jgi:hypothetical protein
VHFLEGTGKKAMNRARLSTLLKRRHLSMLGYQVISVPYWDWEPLSTMRERAKYLQNALRSVITADSASCNVHTTVDHNVLLLRG